MIIKRIAILVFSFALVFTSLPVCTFATEYPDASTDSGSNGTFLPLSAEEYDQYIYQLTYGTEEEKSNLVRELYERANSGISTISWDAQYSQDMGDGTRLVQGFINCAHTQNGMTVYTIVAASMRGSGTYGYTWVTCNESGYTSAASGGYTFTGGATCSMLSSTQIYIGVYGTFEIEENIAIQLGVDLEVMNYSHTVSSSIYYRSQFQGYHIERSPVKYG